MRHRWVLRTLWIATMLVALALSGCRNAPERDQPAGGAPVTSIADIIARRAPELMKIEGVVGVYEGETSRHTPCIRIMVARRTPELDARLPKRLEGVPVEIEETGVIRPMDGGH